MFRSRRSGVTASAHASDDCARLRSQAGSAMLHALHQYPDRLRQQDTSLHPQRVPLPGKALLIGRARPRLRPLQDRVLKVSLPETTGQRGSEEATARRQTKMDRGSVPAAHVRVIHPANCDGVPACLQATSPTARAGDQSADL